jgi:DNA-binding transcriptional LysR family regulator
MLTWEKIKYFYFAAYHLSFTKAAVTLKTKQPVVSKHIKDLEHQLNFELFVRNANGLTLTERGEMLFDGAHKMFEGFEGMQRFNNSSDLSLAGEITISTSMGVASTWLPQYVSQFLDLYPDVRFNIRADQKSPSIEGDEVHLRSFITDREGLVQRYLTTLHMGLYASKGYLEKFGEPKSFTELEHHRLLMHREQEIYGRENTIWTLTEGLSGSKIEPYLKANSEAILFAYAKQDWGIVELAEEYPGLSDSNLIKLFADYPSPAIKLYYIYLKSHRRNKKIITFADYLEEALKSPPTD